MSVAEVDEGETVETLPAVAEPGGTALMRLIEKATLDPNFDVVKLEKLLDVKERWDREEARKAFVVALAAFKDEAPNITKNKRVGYESKKAGAGPTSYRHATLDHVGETLKPFLSKNGLAYRWHTEQAEGGLITVTCVLTHVMGHSESVTLRAGRDESGSKNNIQAVGSTITYLQRYTLLAITGMATEDQDDDGAGATEKISAEQKAELVELMKETNADGKKFLALFEVDTVDDLPAHSFNAARNALVAKKQAPKK